MKKSTTRMLSVVLVLTLMLSQISVPAFAESADTALLSDSETITNLEISSEVTSLNDESTTPESETVLTDGEESVDGAMGDVQPSITTVINEENTENTLELPNSEVISVQSIRFAETNGVSEVGTSFKLQAIIEPSNATNNTILWHSSDKNVAIVSDSGEITAISMGSTIITATTEDGGLMAFYSMKVLEVPETPTNFAALPGDGRVVLYWLAPANQGESRITYFVSIDNGISWRECTMDTSFIYGGLTNGTEYTFLVKAVNQLGESIPTAPITATPVGEFTVYGKGFYDSLVFGDSNRFVSVFGGSEGVVTYHSDNEAVLSVSSDGALTIHKTGTATITAVNHIIDTQIEETDSILITVNKMPISAVYALLSHKVYDGTKAVQVTDVYFSIYPIDFTIGSDYYAVAEYDNENAGNNKTVTVFVFFYDTEKTDNYILSESNTVKVYGYSIEKAPGGTVSIPVLNSLTQTAVTIDPVTIEAETEQPIEYAISQESGVTPVSGWQTERVFENLTPDTVYYVYARTQENENYYAGTAQQSDGIKTATNKPEMVLITYLSDRTRGEITASVDDLDIASGDKVEIGKTVIFTAIPNPGFKFNAWIDNGIPVEEANSIYVIENIGGSRHIIASFAPRMYGVIVSSEGENHYGSGVSPFENWVHISAGEPPANKRFSHWESSSDGVIFDSPTSPETHFPMPANDVTVTAVFEDIPPVVSSVVITPDIASVQKGTSYTFNAEVHGEYNPSQSVIWEVIDGAADTDITSDGILTVGLTETSDTLTVKATSAIDSNKYGIAIVNVTPLPAAITGVDVLPSSISLEKGESYTFTAIVTGENEPSYKVNWSVIGGTQNTTINPEGKLIVDENETAASLTIIATSEFDMSQSGTATVTVKEIPPIIPTVSGVEITPNEITLTQGESLTFNAIVIGENNPAQMVEWSVIGVSGATAIDEYGVLTVGTDEAAVTLTVKATSLADSSKCGFAIVNVLELPQLIPVVTSVEVTPDTINLTQGSNHVFNAVVTGENDPPQTVEWTVIGGNDVTSIDADGILSVDIGETANVLTVKATSIVDSSKFGIATVVVDEISVPSPTVTGIEVLPDTIGLSQGDSYKFTVTVTGTNNPSQEVIWSVTGGTDGTTIAADGTLIISSLETADNLTVVATSSLDLNKSGTAVVSVIKAPPAIPTVTEVNVIPGSVIVNRGDTYDFSATVLGLNNPSQEVAWSIIGGNGTSTINSSGTLTVDPAESVEVLTVKATSIADNTKYSTATVTVIQPPTQPTISSVDVTPGTATVEKGSSCTFTAHVTGNNNPLQSVIWSVLGATDGTSIDDNGFLTVSDSETADTLTIMAVSVFDGSKSGTALVSIPQIPITTQPPLNNPEIPTIVENPQSVTVYIGGSASLSVAASVTDGGTLSYQWYRNNADSNIDGTLIEGATEASYTPPTGAEGVTYYYVVVTNSVVGASRGGVAATVSSPAVLTVKSYPSNNGGNDNNSSGNYNNSNSMVGQNNSSDKNTDIDTISIETFAFVDYISINGIPANATINDDGVLEVIYSASDLTGYADKSGNCVMEIMEQSHIYLSLPIPALEDDSLTIKTDFGIVTVPNTTLQALRNQYGDELRLIIKKGSFVIAFVDSDGKEIAYGDSDNPFIVALPYTLSEGQNANSVIAVKKTAEGNITVPLAYYQDGYITFPVTTAGTFDVLYNPKTFTDTENHWAADKISFVAARGIVSGTGNGAFMPDEAMTRAMFLTVLARVAGADLSQYTASRFADVSADTWYTASVEWAASTGLVSGVGNGNFAPTDPITREQMAVVLDRFVRISGYTLTPLPEVTLPADSHDISAWALEAVENIQQAGIIGVNADSMYAPQSVSTRAEAVAVIVRLIWAMQ